MSRVVPVPARAPVSDWTVELAKAAISDHERGRFTQSARLADALGRDARFAGDLGTRTKALGARAGLPFNVLPSEEGDQRRATTIARRVAKRWWTTITDATITAVQRDTVLLGANVGWIEWVAVQAPDEWVPVLHPLPPHNLAWDDVVEGWTYQTMSRTEVVTPGDGFWFLHAPNGPRSWMGGAVRALGLPFVQRSYTQTDWSRYNEKHGLPILQVDEPYFATDDVEEGGGATNADAFYAQFSELGREGVLRLPQGEGTDAGGWKARWMELVQNTWQTFPAHLQELGALSRLVFLGHSEQDAAPRGGDGETSRDRVRLEFLASDCEPLATTMREQVWMPWGRFNVPNWSDELAPWGQWDTQPAVDRAARATMIAALARAIPALAAAGADLDALLEEFQIKRAPEGAPRPAMPAPQPDGPPTP